MNLETMSRDELLTEGLRVVSLLTDEQLAKVLKDLAQQGLFTKGVTENEDQA